MHENRANDMRKAQAQFLSYLEELTSLKRARWVRSDSEVGRVLCRIAGETIVFKASNGEVTSDGNPVLVNPDGDVGGVVCEFRNWTWLWLTPLEDGQRILGLLRRAKIHHREFVEWRASAYRSGVAFLKDALKRRTG
jgi:hypothetical protein